MNDFSMSLGAPDCCAANPPSEVEQWAVLAQKCRYQREPLAKLLQVSQRTLHRYFKKHLSTTVGTWLRELQLRDAYEQINAGKPLKEAAFEVGFKQASHFTRRFKGRFGILPSVLRGAPHEVLRARLRKATGGKVRTLAWVNDFLAPSEGGPHSGGHLLLSVQVF